MSVTSYLNLRATNAVLSVTEKSSIQKSVTTLQLRLNQHFNNLKTHFQFGSSTRGTILPRSMDEHSDIDYMVVFDDSGLATQTYLDRLKRFVEKYYSRSEVYQSNPTIVLELNHIKFELVPATHSFFSGYQIPKGNGNWQSTDPNDFNSTLTNKNKDNGNLIKPTIRLAKYWNAVNGYVFDSYAFEKWIVERNFFWCAQNQRDFLFNVFDDLSENRCDTQWRKDKVNCAKTVIAEVKSLEKDGYTNLAEAEVKKLIQ